MRELPKINVNLGAGLSRDSRRQITLHIDEGTIVGEVLKILAEDYGLEFKPCIKVPGLPDLTSNLTILLNGRNVLYLEGEATLISDGDRLDILASLVGG